MTEEQAKKVFKLIEPFLPLSTVTGFEELIESYVELKDMNEYNLSFIELQRDALESFGKRLSKHEEDTKELKVQLGAARSENDDLLLQNYNEQKRFENLRKDLNRLEKEKESNYLQFEREVEKNYQLIESLEKVVDEKRRLLELCHELKQQIAQLVLKDEQNAADISTLTKQLEEINTEKIQLEKYYDIVMAEAIAMKDKLVYEYEKGYKTALYQARRKR